MQSWPARAPVTAYRRRLSCVPDSVRIDSVKLRLFALTIVSSVLLPLALPNELLHDGNALLGVFCIAPFLAAVILSPSFKFASFLGVVFGALSTLLSNFWLMYFQSYTLWTLGGVVLVYVVFNAVLAPVLYGVSKIHASLLRPFTVALTWTLYEYLKSVGFLGFPWGLVAYPVHSVLPIIQFTDITGVWGLSLLMALANSVLAEGLVRRERVWSFPPPKRIVPWSRQLAVVALLAAVALVYGIAKLRMPIPFEKEVHLLLIQQNTDTWAEGGFVREGLLTNQRLSEEGIVAAGAQPDLVVWSETSIGYDPHTNRDYFETWPREKPLLPFVRELGTYLLSGARLDVSLEPREAMNGVVLIDPDGTVVDRYGKQHPVPFAETIPFWEFEIVRRFFREVVHIWAPWVTGNRYTIFEVPLSEGGTAKFGTPVCFEDAFSDLCRRFILEGAELWINLTNDYWSKTVTAETQHFVASKFRCIENRRALVRSTNGGVTAVVDPSGAVLDSLPLYTPAYLNVTVPIYEPETITVYTRFGDYFPRVIAAVVFCVVLLGALEDRLRKLLKQQLQSDEDR